MHGDVQLFVFVFVCNKILFVALNKLGWYFMRSVSMLSGSNRKKNRIFFSPKRKDPKSYFVRIKMADFSKI